MDMYVRYGMLSFFPQPERYIIHKKEGLIHVMRSILKGGETKVPCSKALLAIE